MPSYPSLLLLPEITNLNSAIHRILLLPVKFRTKSQFIGTAFRSCHHSFHWFCQLPFLNSANWPPWIICTYVNYRTQRQPFVWAVSFVKNIVYPTWPLRLNSEVAYTKSPMTSLPTPSLLPKNRVPSWRSNVTLFSSMTVCNTWDSMFASLPL